MKLQETNKAETKVQKEASQASEKKQCCNCQGNCKTANMIKSIQLLNSIKS
jgi:hypothetical protein